MLAQSNPVEFNSRERSSRPQSASTGTATANPLFRRKKFSNTPQKNIFRHPPQFVRANCGESDFTAESYPVSNVNLIGNLQQARFTRIGTAESSAVNFITPVPSSVAEKKAQQASLRTMQNTGLAELNQFASKTGSLQFRPASTFMNDKS